MKTIELVEITEEFKTLIKEEWNNSKLGHYMEYNKPNWLRVFEKDNYHILDNCIEKAQKKLLIKK